MRCARTYAALALAAMLASFGPQASAQAPPPYRTPGGFAIGGFSGASKAATATAGAATLSSLGGRITSEALVTAAGGTYVLTITDAQVAAADQAFASVAYGTATTGSPVVTRVQPGAGTLVIVIQNVHASAALNGTLSVNFAVFKN
jgi:hypothetical protein